MMMSQRFYACFSAVVAGCVLLLAGGCASAPLRDAASTQSDAEVESIIWRKEVAIFDGRGQGDISNYINTASDDYLGWPPVLPTPTTLDALKASADLSIALKGEICNLTRKGFTRRGDTALMYFLNHRTRLGDGMAAAGAREVSQYYENVHVWNREGEDWKLIGGFARLVDSPRD